MAETVAQLVDKLLTIDLKMWHNQEMLYAIRRMSFEEFLKKYGSTSGMEHLYACLKKCCDLNVQRNHQMEAVDQRLVELVHAIFNDEDLVRSGFIQRAHKTY